MKRTQLVAAVLASLASMSFAEGAPAAPTGACYTVWVSAPKPAGTATSRRRKSSSFSARQVLDLEFLVVLPSTTVIDKKIELKLFTPKGHLYQTLSPRANESTPGPRRQRRYRTVSVSLPVAGTTIVNNSLYGTWAAEAYVQGETSPCAKPRNFEIQPSSLLVPDRRDYPTAPRLNTSASRSG